jgi:hypothetical protein
MKTVKCLIEPDELYDIAVIGAPFDTAVSYRPGEFPPSSVHNVILLTHRQAHDSALAQSAPPAAANSQEQATTPAPPSTRTNPGPQSSTAATSPSHPSTTP